MQTYLDIPLHEIREGIGLLVVDSVDYDGLLHRRAGLVAVVVPCASNVLGVIATVRRWAVATEKCRC